MYRNIPFRMKNMCDYVKVGVGRKVKQKKIVQKIFLWDFMYWFLLRERLE
jgi:hypothetical protein